ncbi:unnamed protein product, partial [Phaeothamnion confervicola]
TVNAAGPRGAISVIGDSVLVGSGKFSSTVQSLPELLAADGWGPISFEAGVGYRTSLAKTKLASWKAKGWDAPVVAVNLGANDFGFCANKADPTGCNRAAITLLMDAIGPDRLVWWAKITTFNAKDMNAWNTALEQIAFTHPNLLVWDWPTALANANPPIGMSWDRIHALSPAEYEKRSHLMRDSIRQQASTADFNGGYAAPPAAVGSPLRFHPLNNARALAPTRVAGGTVLTVDMSGVVTDPAAQAVSITLGAQSSARLGYITAYPCDNAQPFASHLNLATDSSRAAQAVVRLSASRTLCLFSLSDTDVTVDVQGWFAPSAALAFVPMTPVRLLDTREPFPQPPDQTVRTLTAPAGAQAVALSLVGLDALSGGSLRVWPCDEAQPPADNLVYRPNEIVAGATYVKVSAAGTVCVQNTATAHAVVDITGAFFPGSPAGGLRLQPAQVTRVLDTRSSLGGWVGRHGIGQPISAQPAPAEAKAVTGTLTMVGPATSSFLTAYPCDVARPLASTGNAARGTDMANTITVGLSADHKVCLYSSQNEATVFDVAGWWVP